jgi:hypothetical protein
LSNVTSCHPAKEIHASLVAVVKNYLDRFAPGEAAYLRFYQIQRTTEGAIEKAAMAELPSGKRFVHQRRIPRTVLCAAKDSLLTANLSSCQTFHELFQMVQQRIGGIGGIGELTVYDTAHRLGAYFGLSPEYVYVHSGVRDGLRALRLDYRVAQIAVADLPTPFHRLRPEQVEDCLCIYKQQFRRIVSVG